jgi:protein-tyrosine phosphatase
MAATVLRRHLASAGIEATVLSAGVAAVDGVPATEFAQLVTGSLEGHRSRRLYPDDVTGADLVLCMERSHVREVLLAHPEVFARTYTLKELVRRGRDAGPRLDGEDLAGWLHRAANGRSPAELLSTDPVDDVADPIGRPLGAYQVTLGELESLIEELVALLYPPPPEP